MTKTVQQHITEAIKQEQDTFDAAQRSKDTNKMWEVWNDMIASGLAQFFDMHTPTGTDLRPSSKDLHMRGKLQLRTVPVMRRHTVDLDSNQALQLSPTHSA
eukprot:9390632-Karenia_brevis.AAC.1